MSAEEVKDFFAKSKEKPLDNMLSFKERTPVSELRKWEKNF
jgi:hypothetical protein